MNVEVTPKAMSFLTILEAKAATELFDRILKRIQRRPIDGADEVRFYRVLLEDLYRRICERHERLFSDFFGRMVFIANVHDLPYQVKDELNGLRALANKVAHEAYTIDQTSYRSATKILSEGIRHFSSVEVPQPIVEVYHGHVTKSLVVPPNRKYEVVEFDRCVVIEARQIRNSEDWVLVCESEMDMARYELRLKDNSYIDKHNMAEDFRPIGGLIAPYTTLHVFKISKDNARANVYQTFHESMIVVEPDFLVDVSTVAKCYVENEQFETEAPLHLLKSNGKWGLLQKFQITHTNDHLFTGTLSNALMDAWLTERDTDLGAMIDHEVKAHIWDAMRLGSEVVEKIKVGLVRQHIPNFEALPDKAKGDQDVIEPTFYSAKYGLFGRLDFLRELGHNPLRKDIYELKSGKSPRLGAKSEHKMQAIGYHLLLRSVYGNEVMTTAAVFYSQAIQNPIRDVSTTYKLEQHFSMARNQFVLELLHLSTGNSKLLRDVIQGELGELPRYADRTLNPLTRELRHTNALERWFVSEYLAFIARELHHQKIGQGARGEGSSTGFSSLWQLDLEEKREIFAIVTGLRYEGGRDNDRNIVTFSRQDQDSSFVAFRNRELVLLYPNEANGDGALRHQVLKANIMDISREKITLRLLNPQANHSLFAQHPIWNLEGDMMESGTYNLMQSILAFLKADVSKRQLYLGQAAPCFESAPPIDLTQIGKSYSASQSLAIRSALSAQNFMLIQGPPGTGKTSRVLAEIVLQLFKNSDHVVFVLAYTNRAVEKLIDSIKDLGRKDPQHKIPILRLSSDPNDVDTLMYKIKNLDTANASRMVHGTRVFVATLSSFLRMQASLPNSIARNTLIIDEASQVLDPQVAGIIPHFDRFILIGDHKQLGPIVTQPRKGCMMQVPAMVNAGLADMGMSIFQRLWCQARENVKRGGVEGDNWRKCMVTLKEHFRMHEAITGLIAHHYQDMLELGAKEKQQARLPQFIGNGKLEKRIAENRVLYIESPNGNGRINLLEAKRVAKIATLIMQGQTNKKPDPSQLGIISPWKAQINCISQEMDRAGLGQVLIDTVERFQGSECKNIILSLATPSETLLRVLTSSTYEEDGIEVDRKLNVSISRAEERLIILGEGAILRENRHYKQLIENIKKMGGYIPLKEARELFSEIQ